MIGEKLFSSSILDLGMSRSAVSPTPAAELSFYLLIMAIHRLPNAEMHLILATMFWK
jgi:hypothetical protein